MGRACLRTISLSFPLAAVSIVLGASFQALGNGFYTTLTSLGRQMLVLLPVAYLLAQTADGLIAIWWSFPIAELMSIVASVVFLVVLWHKTIKHLPEDGALIRSEDI